MTHARLDLALHLRYEKPDLDCFYKARPVLDFFADLRNLNELGYIGIKEIRANWGDSIQIWSALTAPLVELRRRETNQKIYDLEPLIAKLRRQERGNALFAFLHSITAHMRTLVTRLRWREIDNTSQLQYGSEAANAELDDAIRRSTAALRQEAAWKAGAIPTPPWATS
jgi:hypothetical protein